MLARLEAQASRGRRRRWQESGLATMERHDLEIDAQVDVIFDGPKSTADPTSPGRQPAQTPGIVEVSAPIAEAAAMGPSRFVELTIIAQDPGVHDADGRALRGRVRVAADRWRTPFQTHRFHVVSYDPERGVPGPKLNLLRADGTLRDRFRKAPGEQLLNSHDFHAQNVYAIASRTLSSFESALGRRVPWGFDAHQLYLVPHGEYRANAKYQPSKHALIFGLVHDDSGRLTYSCLSHDIVAHETAHALLDGLKPGYFNPSLPDQRAFHEGFADIVALLSVFAIPEVLDYALRQVTAGGPLEPNDVSRTKLHDTVLLRLAEEFGQSVHGKAGEALRQSIKLRPGRWWRDHPDFKLAHNRGEVMVAAVAYALLNMWLSRLSRLTERGPAPLRLAADVGSRTANHLLGMVIRAIDYCPPVEFQFEDFLDAILWSDLEMAPDDENKYRDAVEAGFARYDIGRPAQRIVDMSEMQRPVYERFNFGALRTDPDEVFRFIWENHELLGLSLDVATRVQSIRPSIRVGPDGFVVQETVVSYVQHLDGTAAELREYSLDRAHRYGDSAAVLELPERFDPARDVRLYGGGSIIFDQFGRPKYHFHKPLLDWQRQSLRLESLAGQADSSSSARLGTPVFDHDQAIAALHEPDTEAGERW